MLPAIATAVSGMRQATLRLDASARTIASQGAEAAPGPAGGGAAAPVRNVSPTWMAGAAGGVDMADAMVELISARTSFIANAKVLEITQAMVKQLYELGD
ncbi:MAG: hypothetical protein K2X43_21625 [Hyphomonadaceae bacterium]|nr:hypothetical protein [Hyphomonadaceae bacterium]